MSEGFRGEELYIYPPDTYLKPILVLSRTKNEFAIRWGKALNHFHLLEQGFIKSQTSEWIKIEDYKLFNVWKDKLQDNGWGFYLNLYDRYCPKNMKEKL